MRSRSRARIEMYTRAERYRRRAGGAAPYLLLGGLLLLSVTLGVLHNRWIARARPDPLLSAVRTVLFPFQVGSARGKGSLADVRDWLGGGRRLAGENARLRAENARLKQRNQTLEAAAAEADRLRRLVAFAERRRRPPLAAEVIGVYPSARFDTLTIARGTRDGVREGMAARTPDGLLGQVAEAAPLSSRVLLLTDADSGVGAFVTRKGKVQGVGIVQGTGRGRPLEMLYLKREDDVRPGDRVVSSGYGGVIPPDIPIGVVASVAEDRARFLKSARVAPAAELDRAREVLVLPR